MAINNLNLFNAVIAGAGGSSQQVSVNDPIALDYLPYANAIAQIAVAVDAAIPVIVGGPSDAQTELMQSIASGVFANRYPKLGASYISTASAIAALFTELSGKLNGGTVIPPVGVTDIFVSTTGSDVNGNGSEAAPYLTITHALATILDAAPTKVYRVLVDRGIYTENVALKAWVILEGVDISNNLNAFLPTELDGNITLGASFGLPDTGQTAWVTNIDVNGLNTLDFVAAGATSSTVIYTNSQLESTVDVTEANINGLEFHNCNLFGNYTQLGGFSIWENTHGINSGSTLTLKPTATSNAQIIASGGSWAGPVVLDQDAQAGKTCDLISDGFSMTNGSFSIVASAADTPSVKANYGDITENATLTGLAALLSAQMRVSQLLADFVPNPTAIGAAGVTTVDTALNAALFGATTVEELHMMATPVGSNWGTFIGPHNCAITFYFYTNAGVPNVSMNIYNPGGAFNIGGDALDLMVSGYVPGIV